MYRSKSVQYRPRTAPSLSLDNSTRPTSYDSAKTDTTSTAHLLITTVLANNIHCASCVAYIREVLRDLGPSIWNVDISIVSHEVQIRHHKNLSATAICQSLNDAAFEIYDATTTDSTGVKISQIHFDAGSDGWLKHAVGYWKRSYQRTSNSSRSLDHDKRRRHIQNCDACRKQELSAREDESRSVTEDIGCEKEDAGSGSWSVLAATSKEDTELRARKVPQGYVKSQDALPSLTEQNVGSVPTTHDRTGAASVQYPVAVPKDEAGANNSEAHKDVEEYNILLSISGMTCASCTGTITRSLEEMEFVNSVKVTLLTNSAAITFNGPKENADLIVGKITDLGYDASIDNCWPNNARLGRRLSFSNPRNWRVVLSIGGMTCASCTGSVSGGLEELDFVESVAVDLLTNSGTVIFTGREHIDDIVGKVEDLGYECTVQECVSDIERSEDVRVDQSRSVKLSIAGMFCEHCPQRIIEAVTTSYSGQVLVETSPTTRDPVIEVTYRPQPPYLTIRHIIATISDINKTFKVTVYHPLTLEQRSRAMQLHERRRLLFRLLLSFIVAIPTFLIGVVWMSLVPSTNTTRVFFEETAWAGNVARSDWALFILATPVMFCAADVFHIRALKEIRALWRRSSRVPILRRFYRFGSMNLLISAGTSVAYFASLALLIVDATSAATVSGNGTTYFDSVVFLTFFILIGRFLEAYSKAKTGDAVAMLGKLRPSQALLVNPSALNVGAATGSQEIVDQKTSPSGPEQVDVDLLETGDTVLVPHGISPPADGLVTVGSSQFDESSLTGESRPIIKNAGDKVFAGSINTGKPVTIKITGFNGTSMLDQIVSAVREGQTRRAPVERVADILTGYFVPVITLLAIVTFILWFSLGQSGVLPGDYLDTNQGGWPFWSLEFAIAVFVVACPCGIGLAAPTAMFVGSGLAAKHGILVRGGGEAFQEASNLDVVVFDKTGTLTEGGSLKVTDYDMLASGDKGPIAWAAAKALEESSDHPIARAIVDFCQAKDQPSVQVMDIEEVPGRGIRGKFTCMFNAREVPFEAAIGNESFIASLGVDTKNYFSHANVSRWKTEGKSVALLAMREVQEPESGFTLAAQFATTDPIRPEAPQVVRKLQEAGLSVYMLSGDNPTTATSVGQDLGIPTSNIIAGVLPTEKADRIRWLQTHAPKRHSTKKISQHDERRRANVAFIGDGINDAPALTAATVSIAIGSGSDIALSSSSFILLTSNLNTLLTLLDLSKTVFRRIKFNFAWALVYNVCLLPIAAGVIYPARGHPRLGPVWASAAMAASSVSVVLSSLALRSRLPGLGFRAAK